MHLTSMSSERSEEDVMGVCLCVCFLLHFHHLTIEIHYLCNHQAMIESTISTMTSHGQMSYHHSSPHCHNNQHTDTGVDEMKGEGGGHDDDAGAEVEEKKKKPRMRMGMGVFVCNMARLL